MTIGERIKKIRTKIGMSQVAFADRIDVSKQTLYKYENNIITNIPSDKIEAIAQLGKVSPSYLMGWEEEQEQEHGYYLNDETAQIAQEMFENKELRALYDVQRDMTPSELRAMYGVALAMKRREEGEGNDDGC